MLFLRPGLASFSVVMVVVVVVVLVLMLVLDRRARCVDGSAVGIRGQRVEKQRRVRP